MSALQKSLQTQSSDSSSKLEALHTQLQEVKGELQASEDKCSKLQTALEEKAEKLNASQQKVQVWRRHESPGYLRHRRTLNRLETRRFHVAKSLLFLKLEFGSSVLFFFDAVVDFFFFLTPATIRERPVCSYLFALFEVVLATV